ncbi:MAG TPA: sigma-70 family RNA polymerase sigma factor [Blastocatellia bacterium]|nr:sigma-70 family RNA polymerase sigma factor [Blastocatellia bacterium]
MMTGYVRPCSRLARELTPETFERLLVALHPERHLAAEQYEQIRQALIVFFTFRGALDPLELTDETINRVARRLAEGEEIFAQQPRNYFYGVARNVWREVIAQSVSMQSLDDPFPPDKQSSPDPHALLLQSEEQQDLEQRLLCLETCLQKLPKKDRDLMLAYYQGTGSGKIENRQEIAAQFGISLKTLRNKTSRLRSELAICVRYCLAAKRTTTR